MTKGGFYIVWAMGGGSPTVRQGLMPKKKRSASLKIIRELTLLCFRRCVHI